MTDEDRDVSSDEGDAAGDDIRGLMRTTRKRVSEVLLATEQAATDVVEAANADAERIVRDTHESAKKLADERMAKVNTVVDQVAKKVKTLDSEVDGLRRLIDKSMDGLAKDLGLEADAVKAQAPSVEQPTARERTDTADSEDDGGDDDDDDRPGGGDRDRSEAVKVLAAQLIASGHTPEEAEQRLIDEFGVEDPSHALEATGYKKRRFRRETRNETTAGQQP